MNSYLEFIYSTPIIPLLFLLVKVCLKTRTTILVILILKSGFCSSIPAPKPQLLQGTVGFLSGPGRQIPFVQTGTQIRESKDFGNVKRRLVLKPLGFENNNFGEPSQELLRRCFKYSNLVQSFLRTDGIPISSRERDFCNFYFQPQGQGQARSSFRIQASLPSRPYLPNFLLPLLVKQPQYSPLEPRALRPPSNQDMPEMKPELISVSSLEETGSKNFEPIKEFFPNGNDKPFTEAQTDPNHIISKLERESEVPSLPSNEFFPTTTSLTEVLDISEEDFQSVEGPLTPLIIGQEVAVSLGSDTTAEENPAKLSPDTEPSREEKANDLYEEQSEEAQAQTNEMIRSQVNPFHGSAHVLPNNPELEEKNENLIKTRANEVEDRVGSAEAETNNDQYLAELLDEEKTVLYEDKPELDFRNGNPTLTELEAETCCQDLNLKTSTENNAPSPSHPFNIIKQFEGRQPNERILHGQALSLIESESTSTPAAKLQLGLSSINQADAGNTDRATDPAALTFSELMDKWLLLKLDSKDSKSFFRQLWQKTTR